MLRLIGELKRHDLAHELAKAQQHKHKDVVFWANWSALMLGDQSSLPGLEAYAMEPGPFQSRAIAIAFRCLHQSASWEWINKLVNQPGQTAQTIIALSVLGDPHGINWLLARMEEPIHAKIAGYAFTTITGVDLAHEGLTHSTAATDDIALDENDDIDSEIPVVTGYENLPFPHAQKVTQHWQKIRRGFEAGQRYFLGQRINPSLLNHAINNGTQGQRLDAALEYALLDNDYSYANVKSAARYSEDK
jgi:uncharacterized protein (TIGR02270 family)